MTTERSPLVDNSRFGRPPQTDGGNLESLAQQVSSLNNAVSTMKRLAERIGTERDTHEFRVQLKAKRDECSSTARDLAQNLKRLATRLNRSEKSRYDKLMSQFNEILNSFRKISEESIKREQLIAARPEPKQVMPEISQQPGDDDSVAHQRAPQARKFGGFTSNGNALDDEDEARRRADEQERSRSRHILATETRNIDQRILVERNEELKKLESELQGLNDMFVDVSNLVIQQGTMISSIEDNTRKTADETKSAVGELQKASEYQRSSRKKLCCILLLAVIILGLAGAFVGIALAVK